MPQIFLGSQISMDSVKFTSLVVQDCIRFKIYGWAWTGGLGIYISGPSPARARLNCMRAGHGLIRLYEKPEPGPWQVCHCNDLFFLCTNLSKTSLPETRVSHIESFSSSCSHFVPIKELLRRGNYVSF